MNFVWSICIGLIVFCAENLCNAEDRLPVRQRIVNGQIGSILTYSYQASLRAFEQHQCGGAIIKPKYVLTAAHCIDGIVARYASVRAGFNKLNEPDGIVIDVSRFIAHPRFRQKTMSNDIAIVVLVKPFIYGRTIRAINLPNPGQTYTAGTYAVASGWGYLWESANAPSNSLQFVKVPIANLLVCKMAYGMNVITKAHICAGNGKGDACQGDSGGPLVLDKTLIGIVSFGNGCNRSGFPGVYTKVAHYRMWINMNT